MKQTKLSTSLIISCATMILLCIITLSICVEMEIGGYVPLVVVLCSIGQCLLYTYSYTKEAQHVNVPYSSYDKSEYEQELYSPKDSNKIVIGFCEYTPTEEEIREYIKEYQLSEYD